MSTLEVRVRLHPSVRSRNPRNVDSLYTYQQGLLVSSLLLCLNNLIRSHLRISISLPETLYRG